MQHIKQLSGLYTLASFAKKLGIKKSTAVKRISQLRKQGYVKTKGGFTQPRLYTITPYRQIEAGSAGLYDLINKYSPIKLSPRCEHKMIGGKLSVEEAVIRAVGTEDYRVILAALALFNHVSDWAKLHETAREHKAERAAGALYDTAKRFLRVRKMDNRVRKAMLRSKEGRRYIIKGMKSEDFKDIEGRWKIRIPFNTADMMRYKEWQQT